MQFPKISIITPSYNQGEFIEDTILSIINQKYPNLEFIIIDGGSTDNTVDIIEKYNTHISYWVSEKDEGQSDAINKGFLKATGEIINWLNSDDYLEEGALLKIAQLFKDKNIAAATTKVLNFIEGGNSWKELTPQYISPLEYIVYSFNNQPGTFFKKSIWEKYFPLPKQLHFTMDQYLWFCFWLEHMPSQFITADFISVNFRRHPNSKTTNSDNSFLYNTLGKTFFNEHHLLFWSFFDTHLVEKSDILSEYFFEGFDFRNKKIFFPRALSIHTDIVKPLYNHYQFLLLKEDYKLGYFSRFKKNIKQLENQFFDDLSVKEIRSLGLKSHFLPMIKAYRKTYWGIKKLFKN